MLDMIIVAVCQILYSLQPSDVFTTIFGSAALAVSCYAPRYIYFAQRLKLRTSHSISVIRAIPLSPATAVPNVGYLACLPIHSSRINIRSPQFNWRRLQPIGFRY